MRRAWTWLVLGTVLGAAGCMHAAKVFLDIPEGTTRRGALEESQVRSPEAPRPTVFEAVAIEAVEDPDSLVALLPALHSGGIDWGAAWETGLIRPRAKHGPIEADSTRDFAYDRYLSTGEGPEAYFPHSSHADWMSCGSCHPRVYRNGGDSYSSENAHEAESCGACHGPVAFDIQACEECHEVANDLPSGRQQKSLGSTTQLARAPPDAPQQGRIGQGYDLTGSYPPAFFPHGAHRLRYQCRACHDKPFLMVAGSTVLSEDDAHSTEGCGSCHDGVTAFGADLDSCHQCHSRQGG